MKVIDQYRLVNVSDIEYKYENVRKIFDENEMTELVNSVRESGVLNPIWCTQENGQLYLIAGERRVRAAKQAGLLQVPSRIFQVEDEGEVRVLQTIENEQRTNLTQEELFNHLRKMRNFGISVGEMSKMTGLDHSKIRETLGLERLTKDIFERKDLDPFAKRKLAEFEPHEQKTIAEKLVEEKITARRLHTEVLKSLRQLESDEKLQPEDKKEIRARVIEEVSPDLTADRIVAREKIIRKMRSEGKSPKVVDDVIIEKYVKDTDKYYRTVMEMLSLHVELSNPTLVARLGVAIASVKEAIDSLMGRIRNE